jgi:hypothetical protein
MPSYLLTSLFLFALCLLGVALTPRRRGSVLLAAALGVPGAAYSLVFVPAYWNPMRVLPFPIGIEDVLFSFANAGLVWLLVSIWTPDLRLGIQGVTVAKRWLGVTAAFTSMFVAFARAGMGAMPAGIVGAAIVFAALLRLRPAYWRLAVRGAIVFTVLYGAVLYGSLRVWPDGLSQWDTRVLNGVMLFGAPIEETVWACAYGALYPVVMAFLFDARLSSIRHAPDGVVAVLRDQ